MKSIPLDPTTAEVMDGVVRAYLQEISWDILVEDALEDITGQFPLIANGDANSLDLDEHQAAVLTNIISYVRENLPTSVNDYYPMWALATFMGTRFVKTVLAEVEGKIT